jgi:hypothetical protein
MHSGSKCARKNELYKTWLWKLYYPFLQYACVKQVYQPFIYIKILTFEADCNNRTFYGGAFNIHDNGLKCFKTRKQLMFNITHR